MSWRVRRQALDIAVWAPALLSMFAWFATAACVDWDTNTFDPGKAVNAVDAFPVSPTGSTGAPCGDATYNNLRAGDLQKRLARVNLEIGSFSQSINRCAPPPRPMAYFDAQVGCDRAAYVRSSNQVFGSDPDKRDLAKPQYEGLKRACAEANARYDADECNSNRYNANRSFLAQAQAEQAQLQAQINAFNACVAQQQAQRRNQVDPALAGAVLGILGSANRPPRSQATGSQSSGHSGGHRQKN